MFIIIFIDEDITSLFIESQLSDEGNKINRYDFLYLKCVIVIFAIMYWILKCTGFLLITNVKSANIYIKTARSPLGINPRTSGFNH